MTLRELAEQYRDDVETRIDALETEKGVAVIDYDDCDDSSTKEDLDDIEDFYDGQIAHWQATLATINEVLAEN